MTNQITAAQVDEALAEVNPARLKNDERFFKIKRDDAGNFKGFKLDLVKYLNMLYGQGFRRLDYGTARLFIQLVNDRVCREVDEVIIEDQFFDAMQKIYLNNPLGEGVDFDDLSHTLLQARARLFNKELLFRLRPKEAIEFNRDTKDAKYLYFANGFVKITKDGHEFVQYNKLHGFIFESEILNRDYKQPDYKPSYFEQFIMKISQREGKDDFNRFNSLRTIIGYNLHTFSESKMKGTVLTDSKISDDNEPNGRTGKTLFSKALGYMLSSDINNQKIKTFCQIAGKDFDPTAPTKYQLASLDTKLIILNDLYRNFDIECLFNDITEGVTVKQMYKEPFVIFPKLVLSTNKTIRIEGASSKDRFIEFEFSDFFNEKHSPYDEYKHWFFRDWDKNEWNRFYFFMIGCIKMYLEKGLIEAESINLNTRKLRENTCAEFLEFMSDLKIQNGDEHVKKDLFTQFINRYDDFKQGKLKQASFSRWLIRYTKYNDAFVPFNKVTDERANANGDRTIIFRKK